MEPDDSIWRWVAHRRNRDTRQMKLTEKIGQLLSGLYELNLKSLFPKLRIRLLLMVKVLV